MKRQTASGSDAGAPVTWVRLASRSFVALLSRSPSPTAWPPSPAVTSMMGPPAEGVGRVDERQVGMAQVLFQSCR